MRIAGGVLFLLIGIYSLIGGACGTIFGGAMTAGTSALSKNPEAQKAAAQARANMTPKQRAEFDKSMGQVKGAGSGVLIGGILSLIAGILCIIAGIMFFLNKGKMLGFIAAGVGILGEVVFMVMVGFAVWLVIKILVYAFCGFAATKVGQAA